MFNIIRDWIRRNQTINSIDTWWFWLDKKQKSKAKWIITALIILLSGLWQWFQVYRIIVESY